MELKQDMKVVDKRNGTIGTIKKLGAKTSKVRIPIFGKGRGIVMQIPNERLVKR